MKYISIRGLTYYLQFAVSPKSKSKIYYFTRKKDDDSINLPEGYEVIENSRGIPVLRKIR